MRTPSPVTNTEETSHTRSESRSRTDGVSVGDEISYELVYDHTVRPETLMALPEDQMLAPHVVAGVSAAAESRMVALVVDPSVVGTDAVASVSPHEIPAYEPPAPRSPLTSRTTSASRGPPSARAARPTRGSGGPAARPSAVQAIPARQQEEQRPDTASDKSPEPEQDNDEHERSQPTGCHVRASSTVSRCLPTVLPATRYVITESSAQVWARR